jgi:hypothetical protein
MARWTRIVLGIYAAACAAALLFIVASTIGWFGLQPSDSTLLPAFALALPWSLITVPALNTSVEMVLVVLALCMALNLGGIAAVVALLHGRRDDA